MPFLLISPKIVPKIQLIKKGGCFEYHAVIADKIEYRYIHRASICPASGMDRRSFFMPKTMGKYKRLEVFHLSKPVYTADKPSGQAKCHTASWHRQKYSRTSRSWTTPSELDRMWIDLVADRKNNQNSHGFRICLSNESNTCFAISILLFDCKVSTFF